jgi:hypothetical protein
MLAADSSLFARNPMAELAWIRSAYSSSSWVEIRITWGAVGVPRLLGQLAGELEPAFAAQVDIDERDVWPQFGNLPKSLGPGPGSPDDIEALLDEQTAHFLSEVRVVVDD